jgi:hypothetical protein
MTWRPIDDKHRFSGQMNGFANWQRNTQGRGNFHHGYHRSTLRQFAADIKASFRLPDQ